MSTEILSAYIKNQVKEVIDSGSRLPEALRNSHIYITGGTGFLGSWLLEFISVLNDEHNFKIKATITCRTIERFSKTRSHLFSRKDFNFDETDVRNLSEIPKDVTHIIHAAAFTNRNHFATYPTHVLENNINSTIRIFRLAQQLGSLQNILLISSGLVYGRQNNDLSELKEDSFGGILSSFDANHVYAESKRASESIAAAFLSETTLPISVARPFAFVGPYQSLELPWAVTDFIRDAFQGGPIKIMGDGSTVRSIMYSSDFANWILHITAFARPRSVYNVGSSSPVDLLSLATLISSHFNPKPQIITSAGNVPHHSDKLVPSVSKAESELGLKIKVNLNDSISRSIEWHRMIRA
jgi:nucleoside-diphosphate-sugar epimerase